MSGWPALLGGLGLVAIAFGLLTALLAAFQPIPLADLNWITANLLIGVLLLGVSVASSFDSLRERMRSGEGRRAGKYGTSAVLSAALGILILGLLAFLSSRYSLRFDWSEQRVNTLTSQSLELLGGLEEELRVTAFFTGSEPIAARDLLERYAHASPRVRLEFADPNQRPDLVAALAVDTESLGEGLVHLALGPQSVEVTELHESAITNALVKLSREEERTLYFLEGHNERPVVGERADQAKGLGRAVEALRNETYRVESLLLAAAGDVPDDADLVIIAGPTRPLPVQEHTALARYLERGGALLVLLDPRAKSDLGVDLRRWGVVVGEDVIFDAKLALFGQATSPFAGKYAAHPITGEMRDVVLFHLARSVDVAEGFSDLQPVVFTGEDSWAEKDLAGWARSGQAGFDEGDLLGPVPVMVAGRLRSGAADEDPLADGEADGEQDAARLVVVGDSDFATNEFIADYQNRDLFVNAVNWLVDDSEHISLRPPISRASRFRLSAEQFMRIQYLSLFVLPETIAVLGVFAWWSRRKGQGR
ncbi:MAG: GldG family protein [Deltaproteobacteria bacterium]|nr:GldG family protein [Deltaproteobacteria bacterium]MBW2419189.1 GldG family protein [Deltaproteobacteria bacterium]